MAGEMGVPSVSREGSVCTPSSFHSRAHLYTAGKWNLRRPTWNTVNPDARGRGRETRSSRSALDKW